MPFTAWKQKITESEFYRKNYHTIKESAKRLTMSLFIFLIMLGVTYVIITPMLRLLSNAFRDYNDVYNPRVYMIPAVFTLENFRIAWQFMDYLNTLLVTLAYCVLITFFQLLICGLAGYGFARFRFFGKGILFACVVFTIIIPVHTILAPLYLQFRYFDVFGIISMIKGDTINLLRTRWPVIWMSLFGMGIRSGLYIFIFRQFFRGLPKELEEASLIDGAGVLRTFFTVMLPNATPALITVGMFSMVWQYNDTFFASLLMNGQRFMSVVMGLVGLVFRNAQFVAQGGWYAAPDEQFVNLVNNAATIMGIMPILLLYFILQRFFMEGIERSGIVG